MSGGEQGLLMLELIPHADSSAEVGRAELSNFQRPGPSDRSCSPSVHVVRRTLPLNTPSGLLAQCEYANVLVLPPNLGVGAMILTGSERAFAEAYTTNFLANWEVIQAILQARDVSQWVRERRLRMQHLK
ncbi:hypothetical protein EDB19DRAFT_1833879 [Suillus lakei]|nr:hypothetical protein EDB19DRAFT_1833879 [Suillus lakei]